MLGGPLGSCPWCWLPPWELPLVLTALGSCPWCWVPPPPGLSLVLVTGEGVWGGGGLSLVLALHGTSRGSAASPDAPVAPAVVAVGR